MATSNPGQPIAIGADDAQVCVYDPRGHQAQDPGNHHGCPADYESLVISQSAGAYNGRSAQLFRYPINAANDTTLPTLPTTVLPPSKLRFKRGKYQMHVSVVGDDNGITYASASADTTVLGAIVDYSGATSGPAEQPLLATTTVENIGGPVIGDVVVRVTLTEATDPLVPSDATFEYPVGASYVPLSWTEQSGALVATLPPGSFALFDGFNEVMADRATFHRIGTFNLLYELVDAATGTNVYASQQKAIMISPNAAIFSLSDLHQVYDGTSRAVTVTPTPSDATYTTVYEALTGASCPAAPSGSNTTPPTDAGSYCVYVTTSGNYLGSATGTLVVDKAVAMVSIDGANAMGEVRDIYDGNPKIVTGTAVATTAPTGTVTLTYNGNINAPIKAGTYSLLATLDNDPNYTGAARGTLVIATASGATITLDDVGGDGKIHRTFTGSATTAVTATTNPSNLSYDVTYVGDGSTNYPLTMVPPIAVGQYHVVATTTDPNYDQVPASGTLTIDPVDASLTIGGDAVGVVTVPSSTPIYSIITATSHHTGTDPAEQVQANLIVNRNGGDTMAGDLDVDYLAPIDLGGCVAASPSGYWCPLLLVDAGGGTLSGSFGPFTLQQGDSTTTFRARYHRGGLYTLTTSIDGVDTGTSYASAKSAGNVAELALQSPGANSGTTGEVINSASQLQNIGTSDLSAAAGTPNNENVIGKVTLSLPGGLVPTDVLVKYFNIGTSTYDPIPLTQCGSDLCLEFGTPGLAVPAGYSVTTLFQTTYLKSGTYNVTTDIVGTNTAAVFASNSSTVTINTSAATIAFDPASLNQVYNAGTHPVIVTTTPSGLSYTLTYGGSSTAPIDAGDYAVVATITQPGYSGSASDTLHVAKEVATVTISDTTQTYDGNPKPVTVTTAPSGLGVDVTYGGNAAVPSAVGNYAVVATVTDQNYSGSTSETLQILAAPAPDLGVIFSAGSNYVQYGKTLTYVIIANNLGNTVIGNASLTDNLPPELDASTATWTCYATGAATCTTSGAGTSSLSGTMQNLPVGGGVTYVLSVTVRSDAGVPTEQVINMASVSAAGDTNVANDSVTATTQIVIFRDGFENGGNGAQGTGAAMTHQVGSLDATGSVMLASDSAPPATNTPTAWIHAADAHGREVFRIQSLRIADNVLVQVVTSDANGHESHSEWMTLGTQKTALALATPMAMAKAVIVLGANNASVQVAIPASASLPLTIYAAR